MRALQVAAGALLAIAVLMVLAMVEALRLLAAWLFFLMAVAVCS